jgi:hypothetical protein
VYAANHKIKQVSIATGIIINWLAYRGLKIHDSFVIENQKNNSATGTEDLYIAQMVLVRI